MQGKRNLWHWEDLRRTFSEMRLLSKALAFIPTLLDIVDFNDHFSVYEELQVDLKIFGWIWGSADVVGFEDCSMNSLNLRMNLSRYLKGSQNLRMDMKISEWWISKYTWLLSGSEAFTKDLTFRWTLWMVAVSKWNLSGWCVDFWMDLRNFGRISQRRSMEPWIDQRNIGSIRRLKIWKIDAFWKSNERIRRLDLKLWRTGAMSCSCKAEVWSLQLWITFWCCCS